MRGRGLQYGPDLTVEPITKLRHIALAVAILAASVAVAQAGIGDLPEGVDPLGIKGERLDLDPAPELHIAGWMATCGDCSCEDYNRCITACENQAQQNGRIMLAPSCRYRIVTGGMLSPACTCNEYDPLPPSPANYQGPFQPGICLACW